MPRIQQKTPRTRIQGRVVVDTLCNCPGHPHNFHTTEVEVDQVVVEDGRKDMPIKALKDHFGKKKWREVASYTWSVGPTLTPLQPGELTVEVGRIDPAAVPLSEMLKLGPNAGLLADLVDSLFADPKGST